jgi:hypothetical protein
MIAAFSAVTRERLRRFVRVLRTAAIIGTVSGAISAGLASEERRIRPHRKARAILPPRVQSLAQ